MTDLLTQRLWQLDPERGHAPWRASAPQPERVLHVHLRTGDEPQTSLCQALASLALPGGCRRFDWTSMGSAAQRDRAVVAAAAEHRPSLIFMQLQSAGVLSPQAVADARRAAGDPQLVVACWCGDVGGANGPGPQAAVRWAFDLAQVCDLMLYSSLTQVRTHRSRGMHRAAYLQIGYDEDRFHEGPDEGYGRQHDIVFLGSRYDPWNWSQLPGQEASLRTEVVEQLRTHFGRRFRLYGNGWGASVGHLASGDSGTAYRHAHLGLSISLTSRLERYSSDRLMRALACGCATLLKAFDDWPSYGFVDGHNVIVWDCPEQAVRKAKEWLSHAPAGTLRDIGRRGAALAREHHGWGIRMQEFNPLLAAVRGIDLPVWRPW
jgi:Glycosyl transferases group 1